MSAASDKHEKDVADHLTSIGIESTRPKVSTDYSDVLMYPRSKKIWLEVKMNHTDNLGNTRVFYDGKKWDVSRKKGTPTPLKQFSIDTLNKSVDAKRFVEDLAKFANMREIKIPTTMGGLKDPKAVPLDVMKEFFKTRNRYIMKVPNVNMGKLVTDHYIHGKAVATYYMQAADDFYRIGSHNPLGLSNQIPMLAGMGEFKMRISTRSRFYEVQPEVKIMKMPVSGYSVNPGSKKKNPFLI